jgi:putative transcriptional regulator
MDYIKLIKKLREKAFLSQTELAQILGVSFTTVNRWETGKFNPTIKAKKKLNELFIKYNITGESK